MLVLSTNVSQPQQVEYRGQTISTGIFKIPARQALQVNASGVTGDTVCDLLNHGGQHKAVYGFSLEHYDHWRETLGKPALGPGAFGENLTMSSLDENTICIGDQLQIGTSVLEVSQPRVPCFKLGIALEDERAPALFTQHYFTGVYFRVVTPGEISVDDAAQFVHRHPAAISVHQLFRAIFDRSWTDSRDVLAAALKVQELAPEWQDKVLRQLAN